MGNNGFGSLILLVVAFLFVAFSSKCEGNKAGRIEGAANERCKHGLQYHAVTASDTLRWVRDSSCALTLNGGA